VPGREAVWLPAAAADPTVSAWHRAVLTAFERGATECHLPDPA
jgi:hypothetical protein